MKHRSTNWAILCMLCEAVRRSAGSTVYTWERPNNHSTGTWHTIGEPACWEKTQLYTCISGRRDNENTNVYVFDRQDSKPPWLGWQNLDDHTPHKRNNVSQWCRRSQQWLVGLFCRHFQLIWVSTWSASRKFWRQNFRNINIFMTHNAFLTTKIYELHCAWSLTCWYILFTFTRRWISGGDGQSLASVHLSARCVYTDVR